MTDGEPPTNYYQTKETEENFYSVSSGVKGYGLSVSDIDRNL